MILLVACCRDDTGVTFLGALAIRVSEQEEVPLVETTLGHSHHDGADRLLGTGTGRFLGTAVPALLCKKNASSSHSCTVSVYF